ncbi:Craniofacial development protein 2 [Eumeta japonica]|uniref:Craniofacial development protein 2 n=1 Tax=Eumeta variegata TaxID=151549 RepID=A0A4C1W4M4_EUMVA|nr:Craniofacial development protein 2 [Eumeta japonica]
MRHLPTRLVPVEDYDQNPPKTRTINQIHIATYNVRKLSSHDRLIELEEAIKQIKYDVIGISEVRRQGPSIEEYNNFILCYVGQTPVKYGVGFVINKLHKNNIESFTGITERVAVLNINFQGYKLTIIQAYSPTETANENEIEEFYKTLDNTLENTHNTIILMGDFNAKVGITKEVHLITKQFGYGKRNDRGQKLVDYAPGNKLTIINTCFKKNPSRRWTWRSPDATDFYKTLYSDPSQRDTIQNNNTEHDTLPHYDHIKSIDESEIIQAIKRLKLEKSPGSDNTNEALKTAYEILATPLADVFNLILQNSETPTQWSESNIILIYKKGYPKNISNCIPISLQPSLYKLFLAIINTRISPVI